jgi:hypothetical protein
MIREIPKVGVVDWLPRVRVEEFGYHTHTARGWRKNRAVAGANGPALGA